MPTSACCSMPPRTTRPCSCAAMKLEAAWAWMTPVLDHWTETEKGTSPTLREAGGMDAAAEMMRRDGRSRHEDMKQGRAMIIAEHLYASSGTFWPSGSAWITAKSLVDAIAANGQARLLVSGGSTPKAFFAALSKEAGVSRPSVWSMTAVESFDPNSNAKLVGENLLVGEAFGATFQPLFDPELGVEKSGPASRQRRRCAPTVVLGWAVTAIPPACSPVRRSWSSCRLIAAPVIAAEPTMEPMVTRLTHSGPFLAQASRVFLHFEGAGKREVYEDARLRDQLLDNPDFLLLHHPHCPVETFWAP